MSLPPKDATLVLQDLEDDEEEEEDEFLDCREEQDDDDNHVLDPFNALPDELVVKILSYLPLPDVALTASLVNRRLRALCLDASLWTRLQLPLEKTLTLTKAHELLDRCSRLKHLSLKRRTDSDFLAIYALQHCPRLEELEMVYCEKPTPLLLETIAEHGRSLWRLNLWGTGLESSVLTSYAGCLQNLTHIDMFNCKGLKDDGLRAIANLCCSLEYFNMEEVEHLSDGATNDFLEAVKGSIRCLLLDGESLTDKSFKNLGKCVLLEKLGITFADEMRSKGLRAISQLSRLNYLKIRRGKMLLGEDFFMAFSGKKLKELRHLDLSECAGLDDLGLQVIAGNCQELVDLNLDWCWELTDASVRCIILRCSKLQRLELVGIINLTCAALQDVTLLLPWLKVLDLQQCPNIDDNYLQEIAAMRSKLLLTNYYGEQVFSTGPV